MKIDISTLSLFSIIAILTIAIMMMLRLILIAILISILVSINIYYCKHCYFLCCFSSCQEASRLEQDGRSFQEQARNVRALFPL